MRRLMVLWAVPVFVGCSGSNESVDSKALPLGCSRTQFEGDELCIAAPDPSEGLQLHVGPKNYDDEAEVAPFLIQPTDEKVECYTLKATNPEPVYYFEQQNRMRPGSHHMIIRVVPDETPLGWGSCNSFRSLGGIPGSQTQVRDIPGVEIAPENANLARLLPAYATVQFELHYVNNYREKEVPLLREAWVNLFYKDASEVQGTVRSIAMIGGLGMEVPAHQKQTLHYSCQVPSTVRVFNLFGHFHAHTERFSAWRVRATERELVYRSYDWNEPLDLVFDTINENPAPDEALRRDGGWSGPLEFQAGDTVEWECDVNNTLDQPLRFANEAYTAEMCILFGGYVAEPPVGMTCVRF